MAHFAEVNTDGLVLRVLVTDNDMPKQGLTWLNKNLGGTWIQTSYNTIGGQHLLGGVPLRKNFAGIGFTHSKTLDAFIPPQPFGSWIFDPETCQWLPPVPYPETDGDFIWNESSLNWVQLDPAEDS